MPVDPAALQARIAALRGRFVARLQREAEELAGLLHVVAAARSPAEAEEPIRRIRFIAHGLHGAAEPFGFPAIGDAAARAEHAADMALGAPPPEGSAAPLPDPTSTVHDLTRDLIGLARAASQPPR